MNQIKNYLIIFISSFLLLPFIRTNSINKKIFDKATENISISFNDCYSLSSIIFDWDDIPGAIEYNIIYLDGSGYTVTTSDSEILIDQNIAPLCYGQSFSITVNALDNNGAIISSGNNTCNFICPSNSNISFSFTPNQSSFCIDFTGINESQLNISVTPLGNGGVPLFNLDCGETSTWSLSNGDIPINSNLDNASFDLSNLPSGNYTVFYNLTIPNCLNNYIGTYDIEVTQLSIIPPVSKEICIGDTVDLRTLLTLTDPQVDTINFYSQGTPPNLDPANILNPPIVSPTSNTFYPFEIFYVNCSDPTYSIINLIPNSISTNTFIGNDIQWSNPSNWSLGIIPKYCHNVIIPSGKVVVLLNGEFGKCNTLDVDEASTLIIPPGALFHAITLY